MLPYDELDLSRLSPAEALLRVFDAFDHLEPGDSIAVRSKSDLRHVIAALEAERRNLFDWFLLENGPDEHEIEISRRRDARHQHIGEFMERDHRRLEGVLCDVECRTSERMFASALRRLRHLQVGLTRHTALEERFIYPEYERIASEAGTLVRRLRTEHAILLRHVARAHDALIAADPEEAQEALSDVRELLIPHARNEVTLVYPVIDYSHRAEGAGLVRSLQSP